MASQAPSRLSTNVCDGSAIRSAVAVPGRNPASLYISADERVLLSVLMWRAGGVSVRSVVPDLGSVVKTQTVTILFCDLVASTERRAGLGDDAFDAFTYQFLSALREVVAAHEGREVK